MWAEVTLKFKYPLNPGSYPDVENEDYQEMLDLDMEEFKNGDLAIEDLIYGNFEITEAKVIEDPPVTEEVIELPED